VSLDPQTIDRLELLGNGVLSAGIEIVAHQARGLPPLSIEEIRRHRMLIKSKPKTWIVFELVDGEADPPPPGENIDAWRDL
jgi:hypothetical protein